MQKAVNVRATVCTRYQGQKEMGYIELFPGNFTLILQIAFTTTSCRRSEGHDKDEESARTKCRKVRVNENKTPSGDKPSDLFCAA